MRTFPFHREHRFDSPSQADSTALRGWDSSDRAKQRTQPTCLSYATFAAGIKKAVMAGQVRHAELLSTTYPHWLRTPLSPPLLLTPLQPFRCFYFFTNKTRWRPIGPTRKWAFTSACHLKSYWPASWSMRTWPHPVNMCGRHLCCGQTHVHRVFNIVCVCV